MTRGNGQPGMVVLLPPHNTPAREITRIDYIVEVEIGMMRGLMRKNNFHGGLMKGLALAHPQVSEDPLAIFVTGGRIGENVYINAKILEKEGSAQPVEACLSFPGKRPGKVVAKRASKLLVEYRDTAFKLHTETVEGLLAQVFQHEIEHFNGKNIYGWRAN